MLLNLISSFEMRLICIFTNNRRLLHWLCYFKSCIDFSDETDNAGHAIHHACSDIALSSSYWRCLLCVCL